MDHERLSLQSAPHPDESCLHVRGQPRQRAGRAYPPTTAGSFRRHRGQGANRAPLAGALKWTRLRDTVSSIRDGRWYCARVRLRDPSQHGVCWSVGGAPAHVGDLRRVVVSSRTSHASTISPSTTRNVIISSISMRRPAGRESDAWARHHAPKAVTAVLGRLPSGQDASAWDSSFASSTPLRAPEGSHIPEAAVDPLMAGTTRNCNPVVGRACANRTPMLQAGYSGQMTASAAQWCEAAV
jgi:hypothetical protein